MKEKIKIIRSLFKIVFPKDKFIVQVFDMRPSFETIVVHVTYRENPKAIFEIVFYPQSKRESYIVMCGQTFAEDDKKIYMLRKDIDQLLQHI